MTAVPQVTAEKHVARPEKLDAAYQYLVEACTTVRLVQISFQDPEGKIRKEVEELTQSKRDDTMNLGASPFMYIDQRHH